MKRTQSTPNALTPRRVFPDGARKNIPEPTADDALPPGQWVLVRGIRRFRPTYPPQATNDWPQIVLCATCDTAHRHETQCPTCLKWAEAEAQKWAWQLARKANSDIVWQILEARKPVAA